MTLLERYTEDTEPLALAKYSAAVDAAREHARTNNWTLTETEPSDIYAEMCMKRIGNFAYGQRKRIVSTDTNGTIMFELETEVDATLGWKGASGSARISITSPQAQSLNERITQVIKNARPFEREQRIATVEAMIDGHQFCYGYCKRR